MFFVLLSDTPGGFAPPPLGGPRSVFHGFGLKPLPLKRCVSIWTIHKKHSPFMYVRVFGCYVKSCYVILLWNRHLCMAKCKNEIVRIFRRNRNFKGHSIVLFVTFSCCFCPVLRLANGFLTVLSHTKHGSLHPHIR